MRWKDLDGEVQAHIEEKALELIDAGIPEKEAWERARREFGNRTLALESSLDVWRWAWLGQFCQDIRYTMRSLRRSPLFTLTTVLSLALGVGANIAIFSIANAVLLRPLPVTHPEELVELLQTYPGEQRLNGYYGWPYFEHIRDHNRVFSEIAGFSFDNIAPVRIEGTMPMTVIRENVTGNYFKFLGLVPSIGRLLNSDDVPKSGSPQVAVVSWQFWQNALAADPSILGKRIVVNGTPLAIVGVAPRSYLGPRAELQTSVWVPQEKDPVSILARLKPGVTLQEARAEMSVLFQFIIEQRFAEKEDPQVRKMIMEVEQASTGLGRIRDQYSKTLVALLIIVGLLLLLACVNITSMLLARATDRQRELTIRAGLGAGVARLARQMLTESMALASLGAILAVPFAYWGTTILTGLIASGRAHERAYLQVVPDVRVLAFGLGLVVCVGIFVGLLPALQAARTSQSMWLRQHSGFRTIKFNRHLGKALVSIQVAIAFALLTVALLFSDELTQLRHQDLGFQSEGVLLASVDPSESGLNREQLTVRYRQLLPRLEQIPGVRSASAAGCTPIEGCGASRFVIVKGFEERPQDRKYTALSWVAPRYFETIGIPLLAGRDFTLADAGLSRVTIISESMAQHYFGGANPIGQFIAIDKNPKTGGWYGDDSSYEVVGVAGDAKNTEIREAAPRMMYLNMFQENRVSGQFLMRTSGKPESIVPEMRRAIHDVLGAMPMPKVLTLSGQVDAAIIPERLAATLTTLFSSLGVMVAGLGLFGLMAYTVSRRTNEIGIRMALGATRWSILSNVFREAMITTIMGLGFGALIWFAAQKWILNSFQLHREPEIQNLMMILVLMLALALVAAAFPARRAARVDPTLALRQE